MTIEIQQNKQQSTYSGKGYTKAMATISRYVMNVGVLTEI